MRAVLDTNVLVRATKNASGGDMIKLSELRDQTGEPITQLLHEAITTYYRVLMEGEQVRSSGDSPPE